MNDLEMVAAIAKVFEMTLQAAKHHRDCIAAIYENEDYRKSCWVDLQYHTKIAEKHEAAAESLIDKVTKGW